MEKGLVIKSTGNSYSVQLPDRQVLTCTIRGRFRMKGIRATNPVAVGDRVGFERDGAGRSGVITHIESRKNYIIRKASNLSKSYQLLACNVDRAWLMVSMFMPRTLSPFIDRFLVSAEAYRIPVSIIFNKIDIYGKEAMDEMRLMEAIYRDVGYETHRLSLKSGEGLELVRSRMCEQINVIAGNSGVGKSSLVKALDPDLDLRTAEVSAHHQGGRHTTTFSEMYELDGNIRIIDTPGIRGFGTIDIEREELFHFFPEIFRASHACRYHNCLHLNEPGCGVKAAIEEGNISESRYLNYLMMLEEEVKYR